MICPSLELQNEERKEWYDGYVREARNIGDAPKRDIWDEKITHGGEDIDFAATCS